MSRIPCRQGAFRVSADLMNHQFGVAAFKGCKNLTGLYPVNVPVRDEGLLTQQLLNQFLHVPASLTLGDKVTDVPAHRRKTG
jgi:hypothetical protein